MVMLPYIFGCEIVYEDGALPWAMPLNLSEDEVMKLEVPDIFNSYPKPGFDEGRHNRGGYGRGTQVD
jgi:hypothetical protein